MRRRRFLPIFLLLVFILLSLPADADSIHWSPPRQLAPDTAAFIHQVGHSTDARDTSLWTLWVEREDTCPDQSTLKASRFCNGSWLEPESITSDTAYITSVETAVDADLNPWAVWDVTRHEFDSTFCLWSRRQGSTWTAPDLITGDTSKWGGGPGVTADPEQGIWATWSKHGLWDDSMSILSSHCATDSWAPPSLVARFLWYLIPHDPVITAPPDGKVRSVWTGAASLYSATWDGDSWEDPELIPRGWVGYWPSVCSDSAGCTWVTWHFGMYDDSILCAYNDGTGWTDTEWLGTGIVRKGSVCCDDRGRIWALWTHERPAADSFEICVRYFDGDHWSDRYVVATCDRLVTLPRIVAALGKVWVTWTHVESEDRWLLYYSHTLPSGITEYSMRKLAAVRIAPTIVRGVLRMPETGMTNAQCPMTLLDVAGKKAMDLQPGENDVRHLAPGVYFVRRKGSRGQGFEGSSRKVILTR